MPNTPRITIEDSLVQSWACAICGEPKLRVAHVENLPDYVSCANCGSVFVMEEGGERIMYGKIPPQFPGTAEMALRRWAWPEVIQQNAMLERSEPTSEAETPGQDMFEPIGLPEPGPPPIKHPVPGPEQPAAAAAASENTTEEKPSRPADGGAQEPAARFAALLRSYEEAPPLEVPEEAAPSALTELRQPAWPPPVEQVHVPEADQPMVAETSPALAEAAETPVPIGPPRPSAPAQEIPSPISGSEPHIAAGVEPPPGVRYRVQIKDSRFRLPKNTCAHCLRIPAGRNLIILAPAPAGSQRRILRLPVSLCSVCYRRSNARSPEESGAKLQAHLISALVALLLVISALGVRLVNLQESSGIGVLVLLILAIVGYGGPAFFLLGRSSRFPPPADALYVRSTLILRPVAEPAGLSFEWRNQGFADLFHEANNKVVTGPAVQVATQTESGEAQSPPPP